MISKSSKIKPKSHAKAGNLENYHQPICKYCWLWLISEGLGVGILTRLVGVDGGFAIIPALIIAASLGTIFGSYLSQFIEGKKLQRYFGYFLLAMATLGQLKKRGNKHR